MTVSTARSKQESYFIPGGAYSPQKSLFKSADLPPTVDSFESAPNTPDPGHSPPFGPPTPEGNPGHSPPFRPPTPGGNPGHSPPFRPPTPGGNPGLIPRPFKTESKEGARPYYDEAADARAQASYYNGFSLSADGAEAFDQLSKLVKETHTTRLEYAPEKYVYPWVDRRPNGQVESIYSPDSLTRVTPAKQAAIDGAMAQMVAFAPLAPETVAAHMSLVQTAGALNCEHVVPQSWYDAKEPMRGDLHHLFACDSRCNSYRGNRAYRESTGAETETVAKCGIRTDEDAGFQPQAGHGAVARATLYFMLRYPKKARAYGADDIAMLLKWSKQDPPSLYEKHRNAAIEELQGNRNPFIDHPEWAEKVDWTDGVRKRPVQGGTE